MLLLERDTQYARILQGNRKLYGVIGSNVPSSRPSDRFRLKAG